MYRESVHAREREREREGGRERERERTQEEKIGERKYKREKVWIRRE